MKLIKVISLLILFIPAIQVMAQDNDTEFKSIFNLKAGQKLTHGGYGAFDSFNLYANFKFGKF